MPPKEEEEIPAPQRPPSPPPHTTFGVRGILPPTFSAFKPRDYRMPSPQAMNHVAWSCDGKKLAAVGIDKITRLWQPEKGMEARSATMFSGGHSDEVDHVTWNPTHPELFCTSSGKDRRIVFWDARQSRCLQQVSLKQSPLVMNYSPDGKTIVYTSAGHQMYFLECGQAQAGKETWSVSDKEIIPGSRAMFNHTGDGIVLTHHSEHTLRVLDYPRLLLERLRLHTLGDAKPLLWIPRGRYLASGGFDSIVNLFDLTEWICARTITACEYVSLFLLLFLPTSPCRHQISSLSFSHDGEYLAIGSTGVYVDICATETSMPLHRVPALAPAPTVTWHPSRYVIAYCGQTKAREGGPPPVAVVSLFGALE
ncbi:WD40-repeat-containing domain protein [Desarmillaria tabescens]|uniref:WD40-repeat-containing domain protein n=1 Tax=Armillaria tabescens TaxID=1929756 RepID=A0AA39TVC6_ARMTA|nr:WD40-repeat-containing domain protein [Desarmillaria tabescens]KAK0464504.1 WD40-repeat-containing domain protein [Desarmillaria tabescens]